jgi:hypothetical protein
VGDHIFSGFLTETAPLLVSTPLWFRESDANHGPAHDAIIRIGKCREGDLC